MLQNNAQSANEILAALPETDYQRLAPYLTEASLSLGTVLYEASERIETVYFPYDALISLVSTLENGSTTEIGLIGRTGMVGFTVTLDNNFSINRAVVQVPGSVIKISANIFKNEFNRGEELQRVTLRYMTNILGELSQLVVCNNHHTVEERLARWLLMVQDLIQSDNLPLTHEFLSTMLGVRRASVTVAAGTLQRAGMIRYARGNVIILDREALEATACECYGIIKQLFRKI